MNNQVSEHLPNTWVDIYRYANLLYTNKKKSRYIQ